MRLLLVLTLTCVVVKSHAADVGLVDFIGGDAEATPSPASLIGIYIVDGQGRRSGVDPTRPPAIDPTYFDHTCCFVGEIPNIDASPNRLDPDDNSGAFGAESFEISGQLPAGIYDLVVFSTVTYSVPYQLDLRLHDSNEKMNEKIVNSFLPPGTTATYTINYDPAPGKVPVVTKVMSFPILRQELQAAFQLKQVGGKRFVGELDDVLAQGERTLLGKDGHDDHRGDGGDSGKREAVAKLREFIVRIESAAKPSKDHGGGRDRDRDDRRFATAVAAQSLTSDAKTLIADLGGKPDGDRGDRGEHDGR